MMCSVPLFSCILPLRYLYLGSLFSLNVLSIKYRYSCLYVLSFYKIQINENVMLNKITLWWNFNIEMNNTLLKDINETSECSRPHELCYWVWYALLLNSNITATSWFTPVVVSLYIIRVITKLPNTEYFILYWQFICIRWKLIFMVFIGSITPWNLVHNERQQ